jgi:hypothetical protein
MVLLSPPPHEDVNESDDPADQLLLLQWLTLVQLRLTILIFFF